MNRDDEATREAVAVLASDAWASACRVCRQPITFGELCPICAHKNDPFFCYDNSRADLKP